MKIYKSTQYIENPQVGDLKLKVNSMWDFLSRSICYQDIEKTFGGGTVTISYDLEECTEVKDGVVIGGTEKCKHTTWKQAKITKKILKQLLSDGYIVPSKKLKEKRVVK